MNDDVAGLVERLEAGICDDKCKIMNISGGCDCAIAASTIRALVVEAAIHKGNSEDIYKHCVAAEDKLRAQAAEIERLQRHVEVLQDKVDPDKSCACGYDDPDHVCLVHSPKLREAVEVEERIRAEIPDRFILDPPDGGDVKTWEGVQRMRQEIERLEGKDA